MTKVAGEVLRMFLGERIRERRQEGKGEQGTSPSRAGQSSQRNGQHPSYPSFLGSEGRKGSSAVSPDEHSRPGAQSTAAEGLQAEVPALGLHFLSSLGLEGQE